MSEASILLPTNDRERALSATIGGQTVLMETVVNLTLAERIEYDADQFELYHGYALPKTAEDSAGWLIMKIERDGNQNVTAKKFASNAFDKKWSLRADASYTYS